MGDSESMLRMQKTLQSNATGLLKLSHNGRLRLTAKTQPARHRADPAVLSGRLRLFTVAPPACGAVTAFAQLGSRRCIAGVALPALPPQWPS